MAELGSPDWWLNRLFTKLRKRVPLIQEWNRWYIGEHPMPMGYEDAEPLFQRVQDTIGLNMCAVVTDAGLRRMKVVGFKVDGKTIGGASDDIWEIYQANNFDRGSKLVRQEKFALSESYVMVDPNNGRPKVTPEHPEQCIVEYAPGSSRDRIAGLKVWLDDTTSAGPMVFAFLDLGDQVYTYAAPTRTWAAGQPGRLAMRPGWDLQEEGTGRNALGEVALVPFSNRARMLDAPLPEFHPAIRPQKRINKTLQDRMAMQDQGAFKAMWATGLKIPRDPVTGEPVEGFVKAINRVFVNENPAGKYGQLEAEDIKQMLEAVRDDVADCAVVVPTSPDQILGKLVNVSGDGLKLAQVSEIGRVRDRMEEEDDSWEDVARLMLKAAGKSVPNAGRMTTMWLNPEYRTDTEQANAATVAIGAGMPEEVAWERYFNAGPDDIKDWREKLDAAAARSSELDPVAVELLGKLRAAGRATGGRDAGDRS